MTGITPRKVMGGHPGADILDGLYRYDEDTDRWLKIRTITKSKADRMRARMKAKKDNTVFHSMQTVKIRTDPRTKKRYVMRRDDGKGVWR